MIAQMAATAGSVAIGSTIGHGLSSMLFGGGSREADVPAAPPVADYQQQQSYAPKSCDFQVKGEVPRTVIDVSGKLTNDPRP